MQKFLAKTFLFLGTLALVCFCFVFILPDPVGEYSYLNELSRKEARVADLPGDRIILVGGSNLAYGINSPLIESAIGMPVINMGLHAGLGLRYQIESIMPYVHKGDIVVLVPEYSQFDGTVSHGNDALAEAILERPGFIGRIRKLDISVICNVFRMLPRYGAQKMLKWCRFWTWDKYKINAESLKYNEQGDFVGHWGESGGSKPLNIIQMNALNLDDVRYAACKVAKLKEKGVRVRIFPPAYWVKAFEKNKSIIIEISKALSLASIPFEADPCRYVYPTEMMYDSSYHLCGKAVKNRTRKLIEDLRR